MEFDSALFGTLLVVFLVSSFCVTIGIGGGILYVPILGFFYKNVPTGVYLSKISILMTSFVAVSYHIYNDYLKIIEIKKKKRILEENEDRESQVDPSSQKQDPPRIFLLLSASLIPWCIIGSNVGTTFHFIARDKLKYIVTTVVVLCLLFTVVKLIFIFRGRIKSLTATNSNNDVNKPVNILPVFSEAETKSVKHNEVLYRIFKPYEEHEVHSRENKIIASLSMCSCIILYYISIRFEVLYISIPLRTFIACNGLVFCIKLRLLFINQSQITHFNEKDSKYIKIKAKIRKFMDTGIHMIIFNTILSFIAGFISGTIGIGSGIFMVPLLQYLELPPLSCTATSNLLTLAMAIATLSRFSTRISLTWTMVVVVLGASFLGTIQSLFLLRSIAKDKITSVFVNVTLFIFCIVSIIVTWAI